jgi:CheY-like chemotaxis protein
MEMGGTLSVGTANVELGPAFYPEEPPAGDYVAVHVTDTGVGMSKDVRSKAFEPFFTTKEIGKGSGLGLSQVLGFAKQSGGGCASARTPARARPLKSFCRVRPVKTEILQVPRGAMLKASARLILVDDDNAVREVTAATLRELGYTVLEAGSGGAALELLAQSANIDLMLIDFAMPGMSDAEVARRVQTTWPTLPILFVTGYADRAALEGVSEAQIIGKPFVDSELHEQVRTALARRAPGRVVRLRPC